MMSRHIKETTGTGIKEYTWIGNDAYSAPVVTVAESGSTTCYNVMCFGHGLKLLIFSTDPVGFKNMTRSINRLNPGVQFYIKVSLSKNLFES